MAYSSRASRGGEAPSKRRTVYYHRLYGIYLLEGVHGSFTPFGLAPGLSSAATVSVWPYSRRCTAQ